MVYVGRIKAKRVKVGRMIGKVKEEKVDRNGCEAEDEDNSRGEGD